MIHVAIADLEDVGEGGLGLAGLVIFMRTTRARGRTTKAPRFEPFVYTDTTIGPTGPRKVAPTSDFVFEVRRELEGHAGDAEAIATWIVERLEEFGSHTAQTVFTSDGSGPYCSWCGAMALLCGHGATNHEEQR